MRATVERTSLITIVGLLAILLCLGRVAGWSTRQLARDAVLVESAGRVQAELGTLSTTLAQAELAQRPICHRGRRAPRPSTRRPQARPCCIARCSRCPTHRSRTAPPTDRTVLADLRASYAGEVAHDNELRHFAARDIADLDAEIEHQPVTAAGPPCICVAALEGPLVFRGWLARKLQPLVGL